MIDPPLRRHPARSRTRGNIAKTLDFLIIVHFCLQVGIIGCLALPWYLHRQHLAKRSRTNADNGRDSLSGDLMPSPTTPGGTAHSRLEDDMPTRRLDDGIELSKAEGGGLAGARTAALERVSSTVTSTKDTRPPAAGMHEVDMD